MTCSPTRPCGPSPPGLGLVPPPPGETILRRRSGEFYAFLADLIATVEHLEVEGAPLGGRWDVEGDPYGTLLARLWASVAEGVAAQTELTAGEAYLATAQDWTDLRRLAALVGYRPRPRIAAQGWVVALLDRGVDPLVPAGTRVQAPGTPARAAQTYEAVSDTQLHAEWDGLTATWVPQPAIPDGRQMRFLGEPGFRVGDQLLFVDETPPDPPNPGPIGEWYGFWYLLTWWYSLTFAQSTTKALSVASVTGHKEELGTSLVSFDRDLNTVLSSPTEPYGAYRILATASPAKRLEKVLRIPADTAAAVVPQTFTFSTDQAIDATNAKFVVLDTILEGCSAGQLVAVVDWATKSCDVVRVAAHRPVRWETAPGTNRRVSRLEFSDPVPALQNTANEKTVYVLDQRVVARHYVFPATQPAGPAQLRLYPDPVDTLEHIAVGVGPTDHLVWYVFGCTRAATQEDPAVSGDVPTGLIVDLVDGAPPVDALQAPASGNLVRIHHGATAKATLGSGDTTSVRQTMTTPDAPIASDVDAAGTPIPTMVLRVDGVQWDEVPSLYAAGPAPVFATRLEVDGAVTVEFGDGEQGARLPTGRNNVTAIYRVGGGTAGEVEAGAIDTLLGSVRGVKKVRGADPTSGGADQDDERRLRQLAPTRARAFGRAVSAEDLADLSLGYPGVSHAAAFTGAGPPGCACGGSGLHLAFLRTGSDGTRAPLDPEVTSLAAFLDARRDATVALCVSAGAVTALADTSALVAVDARRDASVVAAAAREALLDPDGPLAPARRLLGQPLDRSDVFAVLHSVTGVVGVATLFVAGATGELGRRGAERWELVALRDGADVEGQPA